MFLLLPFLLAACTQPAPPDRPQPEPRDGDTGAPDEPEPLEPRYWGAASRCAVTPRAAWVPEAPLVEDFGVWEVEAETPEQPGDCGPSEASLPPLEDHKLALVRLPKLEFLLNSSRGAVLTGDYEIRTEGAHCYVYSRDLPESSASVYAFWQEACGVEEAFRWLEHTDDGVTSQWTVLEQFGDGVPQTVYQQSFTRGEDWIRDSTGDVWFVRGPELFGSTEGAGGAPVCEVAALGDGYRVKRVHDVSPTGQRSNKRTFSYASSNGYMEWETEESGIYECVTYWERGPTNRLYGSYSECYLPWMHPIASDKRIDVALGIPLNHEQTDGYGRTIKEGRTSAGYQHNSRSPAPRRTGVLMEAERRHDSVQSERFAGCSVLIHGAVESFSRLYDELGRPVEERDEAGELVTRWTWDADHRPLTLTRWRNEALAEDREWSWEGDWPVEEWERVSGRQWAWTQSLDEVVRAPVAGSVGFPITWELGPDGVPVRQVMANGTLDLGADGGLVTEKSTIVRRADGPPGSLGEWRFWHIGERQIWEHDLLVGVSDTRGKRIPSGQNLPECNEDADEPLWSFRLDPQGLPDRLLQFQPGIADEERLVEYEWSCPADPMD